MPPASTEAAILLAELAEFPDDLARAIGDVPPEALRRPARDGGWGVIENLGHLRDWEEVFLARARAILAEDRPFLPAFDDALWEIEHGYREREPGALLTEFRELRRQLVGEVEGAPVEAWQREGMHELRGPLTLASLLSYLRDHDRGHLQQVRDALA